MIEQDTAMATTTPASKVARIEEYRESRVTTTSPDKLLAECRNLAVENLGKSFSMMLDKMDENLSSLSSATLDQDLRAQYSEAKDKITEDKKSVATEFKRQLAIGFNKKAHIDDSENIQKLGLINFEEVTLELVQDDEVEQAIAISNAVNKLKIICSNELLQLNQRIGTLLGNPELEENDNPIGPQVILEAFKLSCQKFNARVKVKLLLLKMLGEHMFVDIEQLYQCLNDYLITKNVLPTIKGVIRRKPVVSASRSPKKQSKENSHSYNEQDVFSVLQQLVAVNNPNGSVSVNGTGQVKGEVDAAALNAAANLNHILGALTQLQHGKGITLPGGNEAAQIDPTLLASGSANILRDIKITAVGNSMSQIDTMTLDIVAMIFDYIFDDKSVPDAMKALIGRLQIPVLKVAMIDKSFFSKKTHPTRQLLDRLVDASIGMSKDNFQNDALYKKADDLVHRLQKEFDENIQIFSLMLADLEEFIALEQQNAEKRVENFAKTARDNQSKFQVGRVIAEEAIAQKTNVPIHSEAVIQFLRNHWVNVLVFIYSQNGEENELWKNNIRTIDDLIWSVIPKESSEERKKLSAMLPNLLKQLSEGLRLIAISVEEREKFFSELVNAHVAAVKAGLQPLHSSPPKAENGASSQGKKNQIKPNSQAENQAIPETNSPLAWINSLNKGTWVEFVRPDTTLRVKLAWISPLKGVYLFTNREGEKAISMPRDKLLEEFRLGNARTLENTPLIDRAVNSVIDTLKKNNNTVH